MIIYHDRYEWGSLELTLDDGIKSGALFDFSFAPPLSIDFGSAFFDSLSASEILQAEGFGHAVF
jgi:hypothetical protein